MTKKKDTLTPAKVPATVYDHLISRLVWLESFSRIYDVTPGSCFDYEDERNRQASVEKESIEALLSTVQAKSLRHAFMQVLIVGSELSMLAYNLQCVIDKIPHESQEAQSLYKVRDRLKVFHMAQWSAVEVLKGLPEVKDLHSLIDEYRLLVSPFSDTGKYSEEEPPKESKAA